jgi:serine phosphatase RsbU (regulator of sigma subunit)
MVANEMSRFRPRKVTIAVAVLLLAITGVLTFLTWRVNEHSEQRLLARQLAQVGTLLTNQAAVLQVQLADMGQVAVNTNANPNAFARFAASQLQQTGQSLSLWRVTNGQVERIALQGLDPRLPADRSAELGRLRADGSLDVLGILPGKPDRLAYALRPAEGAGDLVIYAESPLPPGRRLPATPNSPLSGLDIALYLGRAADAGQLLESTAPAPIRGDTQTTRVPFGTATVSVVGASPTHLAGGLSMALPWIVLGGGVALALGGAAVLEFVSRRRAVAERLAAENERLYRQQRGIAGTLQHALLPAVPALDGVEVAARYVAGVDELEVGGDWFDVIELGPGRCVFVVGDISGRGLAAATTMASLRFAVRAYLAEGHDIDVVLTKLRRLIDIDVDHQFATVLLGELDSCAGRLRLVSAGHFGPLLLADGRGELLDCPLAAPVGVGGPIPAATTVALPRAGTLLAFTDGAVERRGEVIDTGLDRLRSTALEADSQPLPSLVDTLLDTLTSQGQKDDTVILGLRWTS